MTPSGTLAAPETRPAVARGAAPTGSLGRRLEGLVPAVDLPPLLVRLGIAVIALTLPLGLLPGQPVPLAWLALPLALGAFTRAAAWLAMLGFATSAFGYLGDRPTFVAVFALAGVARLVYVEGAGRVALDPLPLRRRLALPPGAAAASFQASLEKQQAFHAQYRAFAYRLPLAFILLTAGGLFLWRGGPAAQALGAAWVAVGLALVLGLRTRAVAVAAALAFPIGLAATGQAFWVGLGLCALALAFFRDNRLSLDGLGKRWQDGQ